MDYMEVEEIKKQIKKLLDKERYRHTLNVQKISLKLAKRFNCNKSDLEKISLASLLHDCAKCFSQKKSLKIIKSNKSLFNKLELNIPKVLHAKISAIIAKEKFAINDKIILNAIKKHTTGDKNMSLIDKIIYIADILDTSKNIKGIEKIRNSLSVSIDRAMLEAIKLKISYLIKHNLRIHPSSLKAWNSALSVVLKEN